MLCFQAFLVFLLSGRVLFFMGTGHAPFHWPVSSLHLISLLCMIHSLCPLWRMIRATENVLSGLVNTFYCSSGDTQVNRLLQYISQVPVSPEKLFFLSSHLI